MARQLKFIVFPMLYIIFWYKVGYSQNVLIVLSRIGSSHLSFIFVLGSICDCRLSYHKAFSTSFFVFSWPVLLCLSPFISSFSLCSLLPGHTISFWSLTGYILLFLCLKLPDHSLAFYSCTIMKWWWLVNRTKTLCKVEKRSCSSVWQWPIHKSESSDCCVRPWLRSSTTYSFKVHTWLLVIILSSVSWRSSARKEVSCINEFLTLMQETVKNVSPLWTKHVHSQNISACTHQLFLAFILQ